MCYNSDMDEINQISNSLREIVSGLSTEELDVQLEIPNDLSKGDYSTNIAMKLGGKLGNPMELGEKIVEELKNNKEVYSTFSRIELIKPGFINFWLSDEQIIRQIKRVLSFGPSQGGKESKIIFEFGDPNPFKEPHVGHLRNFALGEAISRLIENGGVSVTRASYQGDVGMHVAKAIWGMIKLGFDTVEKSTTEGKSAFLGKAYSLGAQKYEEDDSAKAEILEINKKIYSKDEETLKIWEKGRKWSLDHFENLYQKLGIKYDKYYFESETATLGKKIVEQNLNKVFEKDDGTIVFRGEKFGLHTRVFVTKEGHATYEGKDLALAVLKDQDFPNANKSIIMTANEQTEYFKVMLSALKLIDPKIADKTNHLTFGFVNLKEGKMSSRTGNVIPAFWLLDEIKKRLKNGFKEVENNVLEQLSVGAVKWAMLKFSRESNIAFSIDESIQIEGNSGPYMQYSYARTQSLLEKSSKNLSEAKLREKLNPELLALARLICQFEIHVKTATDAFSPNLLTNYLYTLAQNFNQFYEKEKVIGSDKEEEKLLLVKAVGEVLKNGLQLLGIASPARI